MTQVFCCGQKSSLLGEVLEMLQKTEEFIEMNKQTLNTNKTELIFFSRNNSVFGSFFLQKQRSHNTKKVADILVFN